MNKQPFYHDAQFTADHLPAIRKCLRGFSTVIKSSIEITGNQILFTATEDLAQVTTVALKKVGVRFVGSSCVDCEPGNPTDLM